MERRGVRRRGGRGEGRGGKRRFASLAFGGTDSLAPCT